MKKSSAQAYPVKGGPCMFLTGDTKYQGTELANILYNTLLQGTQIDRGHHLRYWYYKSTFFSGDTNRQGTSLEILVL